MLTNCAHTSDFHLNFREISFVHDEKETERFDDVEPKLYGKQTVSRGIFHFNDTESQYIANSAVNNKLSDSLEQKLCLETKPEHKPDIKVKVVFGRKIKTGTISKKGRIKTGHGVIFTIDGDEVPVYIKGTTENMLYAMTLIFAKHNDGTFLTREDFLFGEMTKALLHKMKEVFCKYAFAKGFDEWYKKQTSQSPLNTAKYKLNMIIWNALKNTHRDAYYYCALRTKKIGKSRYTTNLCDSDIEIS